MCKSTFYCLSFHLVITPHLLIDPHLAGYDQNITTVSLGPANELDKELSTNRENKYANSELCFPPCLSNILGSEFFLEAKCFIM